MNISYKGLKQELPPKIQSKLDAKFAKLSKLLEQRGEREAHVVVQQQRHLNKAEVTIQFYDHQLVGAGADGDLFTALSQALSSVEAQAVKTRGRWREKHRRAPVGKGAEVVTPVRKKVAAAKAEPPAPRVNKVTAHNRRKPITLEEAILELDANRDYVVYRDADKQSLTVLVRRRDGNIDLIESN